MSVFLKFICLLKIRIGQFCLFLSFIELYEHKSFNYKIIVLLTTFIKNMCNLLKLRSTVSNKKNWNLDKFKKNSLGYIKI